MDWLGMCMDELRVLARSNDPDRAVLVEGHIDTYLTTEGAIRPQTSPF